MSQAGFELHAGEWAVICDVCSAGDPSQLRAGDYSESQLIFPAPFGAGDILFIQDVVAESKSSPPVNVDFERWEPGVGCLFVDRLAIEWVHSIAALNQSFGPELLQRWSDLYFAAEDRLPDWHVDHANGTLGDQLIRICKTTLERNHDLCMVWEL